MECTRINSSDTLNKFKKIQSYIKNYRSTPKMSDIEQAQHFKTLGNEAFKAQKWEQAAEHFSKAIECNPNDHVFYSNRSGSYCNMKQYEKALEDAEKCLQLNQGFARGYQRKGTALFYLDKLDEAIETYENGLQVDPNNAALKNDLKSAEQKKSQPAGGFPFGGQGGQGPEMNQQYLSALMKLMSNPETKDFMSDPSFMQQVQLIMSNPQMAPMLIQNNPKLKKAFQVLQSDAPSNFDLNDMMKNMGGNMPQEAPTQQEAYTPPPTQPKKPEPKKEEKKQETADVVAKNKGNESYKQKKFEQAIAHYDEAISLNSEEPLYLNNKAAVYIEMKQYQKALEVVAVAQNLFLEGKVKDYIKKAKILARKASILAHQQKFEDAIEAYEKSLIEDHNQKAKDQLSRVRRLLKQKQAKEYLNPELGESHCEKGNALFKEGKFPQALAEYEEAIRRDPSVAKYHSNLGTAYIKLVEFPRARDCFDKALEKDPKFVKAYAKKGDCHYMMKEFHKALESYEAGLKIDSQNQLCKQGIQKTQMAIFSSSNQEDQETRAKRAMQDPEIQQILQTPEVRNALSDLERDPKAINNVMKNPELAKKFQKLIQAGILKTG